MLLAQIKCACGVRKARLCETLRARFGDRIVVVDTERASDAQIDEVRRTSLAPVVVVGCLQTQHPCEFHWELGVNSEDNVLQTLRHAVGTPKL